MSSKDQSEKLVTNFYCPTCGRITWSGDKHVCTPPPYKPEGGVWIEGALIAAAPALYAACKAAEEVNRLLLEYDAIRKNNRMSGSDKWHEWQTVHVLACKLMGAAIRKAEGRE